MEPDSLRKRKRMKSRKRFFLKATKWIRVGGVSIYIYKNFLKNKSGYMLEAYPHIYKIFLKKSRTKNYMI